MKPKFSALLVYDRDDRLGMLQHVLEGLSLETQRARSCREAGAGLCETPPPHCVLTDTVLADGNWLDVLDSAAKAPEAVNVVVVSPIADINLYVDVMEHGAFDFVTSSFTVSEIVHVLRCAIDDASRRRQSRKRGPAMASEEFQTKS